MSSSSMMLSLKKFISRFRSKPIELGNSFSLGEETVCSVKADFIDSTSAFGNFYRLKQVPGNFEFVSFVKSGDNTLYQLKHMFTGETINLTKNMFEFFFEKNTK